MREAGVAAPLFLELQDSAQVRAALVEGNLLQQRTDKSNRTMSRETANRLATLDRDELELLVSGTAQERAHLMWVAASRTYALICEFSEEVLRERFLLLKAQLVPADFDSFLRAKSLWHEELNDLAESTRKKLRQNLFKMLREAGLLSVDGHIVPAGLSHQVSELLVRRDPAELRLFPITDADIQRAM